MTRSIEIRRLARTGHTLTTLGLGTAPLGGMYSAVGDAAAHETIAAAWDAGIRYFDTAPFYGYGAAEHRVGETLRERPRGAWTLSTKVGRLLRPAATGAPAAAHATGGDAWVQPLPFEPVFDYSAAGVRRSIEDSLQRLGTHRIDIALVHDIGRSTHGALHDRYWQQLTTGGFRELEAVKREGLIGAIGLGVNEWEVVMDAMQHIDLDCTLLAGRYTLLEQGALTPFLDACLQRELSVIAGGPFNSGVLVGGPNYNYAQAPLAIVQRVQRLREACDEAGVPLPAAALQFPLAHPAVVACLPGVRSAAELRQLLAWWQHDIPAALWQSLRRLGLLQEAAPVPS